MSVANRRLAKMRSRVNEDSPKVSIGYAQATNIFHGCVLDCIRNSAKKNDSLAREFRRQLFNS
jgi:hypothetical protein